MHIEFSGFLGAGFLGPGFLGTVFLASAGLFATVMVSETDAADSVLDRYEARVFRPNESSSLPYRFLRPKGFSQDPNVKYPLVLFYHGAGERGTDNRLQLVHGLTDMASDDVMEKFPCFVVAPQCPENVLWVDTPWTADSHTMPKQPTEPTRLSLELITALEKEFPIDSSRIYVTGLSMGGFGVWDVVQRHPMRFAAAVPVCGGGDVSLAKEIVSVPIWAFHGAKDTVVKPNRSRDMIAALESAGANPKYTEYPEVGHDSWVATYRNREVYSWMFSQRRK